MSTLGAWLLSRSRKADPEAPRPEDILIVTLRGVTRNDYGHEQIEYSGIPLHAHASEDCLVLQPGYLAERWRVVDGEPVEMPDEWRMAGSPVWIPVDSILMVRPLVWASGTGAAA